MFREAGAHLRVDRHQRERADLTKLVFHHMFVFRYALNRYADVGSPRRRPLAADRRCVLLAAEDADDDDHDAAPVDGAEVAQAIGRVSTARAGQPGSAPV